jgi:hypothetical protein
VQERKDNPTVENLEALIGVWSMAPAFPDAPLSDLRGRTVFDWIPGKKFVVQRWGVPHPDAPEGDVIEGRWEIARDGSTWEHDFELTYTRVP